MFQSIQLSYFVCSCDLAKKRFIVFCARCAIIAQVRTFVCQLAIYAQDLRKILSPMRKIVLISPMCKICARLHLFPQCAIYAQDLSKIVLLSPMCNICTRLHAEICNIYFFPPMGNVWARLYFSPQCSRPSHHLCTKHHHPAGHKFSIFLFKLTGRTTYN